MCEFIYILITYSYKYHYVKQAVNGIFGGLSGFSVISSYVCMLLSWSNLYWNFKKGVASNGLNLAHRYVELQQYAQYWVESCWLLISLSVSLCFLLHTSY